MRSICSGMVSVYNPQPLNAPVGIIRSVEGNDTPVKFVLVGKSEANALSAITSTPSGMVRVVFGSNEPL